ncbi:9219_t:CDS:1, partial [Gigaspora rosea]
YWKKQIQQRKTSEETIPAMTQMTEKHEDISTISKSRKKVQKKRLSTCMKRNQVYTENQNLRDESHTQKEQCQK